VKILVIGGTRFFDRRLVEAALANGHELTIFHRGKHSIDLQGNITEIFGDRNRDIAKLAAGKWDAVIDTCGYLPTSVRLAVEQLADSVCQYVCLSSISAYSNFSEPNYDESADLAVLTKTQQETVDSIDPFADLTAVELGEAYGGAKVVCEQIVQEAFPNNSLIVRPGLIVGEFDHTDRFTYWVMRIAKGGRVLAPGSETNPVQFIDARDLAEWTIGALEMRISGAFNANGEPGTMTFGSMLNGIRSALNSEAEFEWVDEDFLRAHRVEAWSELPFFMFETESVAGFAKAGINKAKDTGLNFRSFSETVLELHEWRRQDPSDLRAGLTAKREHELLELWDSWSR